MNATYNKYAHLIEEKNHHRPRTYRQYLTAAGMKIPKDYKEPIDESNRKGPRKSYPQPPIDPRTA